ncbi:MAG: hypothetical protein ACXACG_05755, partial [Candidatus Thorarchaeota archaeon]
EARPFDFDDCGFGYWVFDFGVALSQYMMDSNDTSKVMRNALLKGYEEITTLEGIGIEYLDLSNRSVHVLLSSKWTSSS